MTGKIKLITKSYLPDQIGQLIPTEEEKTIFCDVSSVSATEFANAGAMGLKPSYLIRVWTAEYNGADIVEYNSKRYSVYRTYEAQNGRTELYIQEDVGV